MVIVKDSSKNIIYQQLNLSTTFLVSSRVLLAFKPPLDAGEVPGERVAARLESVWSL